MPVELILILLLLAAFYIAIQYNINIGIVALIFAFLAGLSLTELDVRGIIDGFPTNVFFLLLGLTLLLGAATENGAIKWLVSKLLLLLGNRLIILPWALFLCGLVGGSFGPLIAPVLFVIGLGIARQVQCSPLLMGVMIAHGQQAGLYSPVAPYGAVFQTLLPDMGDAYNPMLVYAVVVAFNTVIAGVAFVALGGRQLAGKSFDRALLEQIAAEAGTLTFARAATLMSFILLLGSALVSSGSIGVAALFLAFCLMMIAPKDERDKPLNHVPWSVLVIVIGVLTYMHVMQEAGAIAWLAAQIQKLGSPTIAALMLNFMSAIATALTSTFGTFGVLIPLSGPFIAAGGVQPTTLLAAIGVSASVTDISPFSVLGAMFLGAAEGLDRQQLLRQMLKYVFVMMLTVPIIAWLVLIVPGW